MTIAVFAGPTVSADDMGQCLPRAALHPPVRYGDVARLLLCANADRPRAIAIIDGLFHQTAAVWHKEILFALAEGVPVYGASSMGALRAAELSAFSMIPHGRIAEAYCSGTFPAFDDPFEADDEVAVLHGPAELGYPATLALVDTRWRLAQAVDARDLDRDCAAAVLARLKTTWYQHRTEGQFRDVLEQVAGADSSAVLEGIESRSLSLKREDALSLLAMIAAEPPRPFQPQFRFEPTQNWHRMVDAVSGNQDGDQVNEGKNAAVS